ncbi:MAG: hypothetical protein H0U74_06450 [Bradymonadaceae bacterium]|nr:hypothetical protein [Lujinxingiaceae bacterium]
MSDDRFKQARRSLIDKHNQRHQQGDDDDFGDDNTQMVDLESLAPRSEPSYSPPAHMDGDDATQMFEIPTGPDPSGPMTSASSVSMPSRSSGGYQSEPSHRSNDAPYGHSAPQSQAFAPSEDDAGFEGHTQFVNLNEFASEAAHFTPEQQAAGYDGNTQFVDVASLMAGGPSEAPGGDIENDNVLRQSYQYGPESIQHGEVTLIFANNTLGQQVVLKRVWEGRPEQMSTPLRQRIAQLNALKHPNLICMNGMLASPTGLWVEMDHPGGARLTALLQEQGRQPKEKVMPWVRTTADVLRTVHAHQLAYANLTTDALWVQPDGSVRIEPFDMLRFEDRGSLGDFGPQEMHRPVEQRQLSPASDVYSLAALAVATMTGLPLELGRVQQLDKNLAAPLQKALSPNPAERPQDIDAFLLSISKKPGFDPSKLDIKVVGAAVAVVLMILVGGLYWQQQEAASKTLVAQQILKAKAVAEKEQKEKLSAEAAQRAASASALADSINRPDQAGNAAANTPAPKTLGAVQNDPRLTITTSYQLNPPADTTTVQAKSPERAAQLREQARQWTKEGAQMPTTRAMEKYRPALEAITEAIRLQDQATEEDNKILADLYAQSAVRDYVKNLRERIDSSVSQGAISMSRQNYRSLSAVDPNAQSMEFFGQVNSAKVQRVTRKAKAD